MRTRSSIAATLLAMTALSTVSAQAQAAVVVKCVGGPVTLAQSNATVKVTGRCTDVKVTGAFTVVSVADVETVTISGPNNKLTAGTLSKLVVADAFVRVSAKAVNRVILRGDNTGVKVAGAVQKAKITGAFNTVKAASVATGVIKASNSGLTAAKGTSVIVRGSFNSVRYKSLDTLSVDGTNNFAQVSTGTTTVTANGDYNNIQVNENPDLSPPEPRRAQ